MDILDIIYESRVEAVAKVTEVDKEYLSAHCNSTSAYDKLENLINESCANNAYNILTAIDDFISELNFENSYFNEKYYKQGFCDGVSLMKSILTKFSL